MKSGLNTTVAGVVSRLHDVIPLPLHVPHRVAGVDDQLRVVGDHLPVVRRVVRRDQRRSRTPSASPAISSTLFICRSWCRILCVARHVRVVVVDLGAELLELLDQLEARALAHVVDVRLVRQAQDEDLRRPSPPCRDRSARSAVRCTTYSGIARLTSPASSMNRVGMPTSRAFHVR